MEDRDKRIACPCGGYLLYAGQRLQAGRNKNELLEQVQRNFRWMPELVSLLRKYEERQVKYGSFENFYPRVIDFSKTMLKGK